MTRGGKDAVVVVPAEDYERLAGRKRGPRSLVRFFSESPLVESGIDLERSPDYGRKVRL